MILIDRMLVGPLTSDLLVFGKVSFKKTSNVWYQWVIRIRVREQRANR